MAVDTPARIVVVGAGPIGLEAALYARFLGYDVDILERGQVAEHVRRWGHLRLSSPFASNSSLLGLAALAAQDPEAVPIAGDAVVAARIWVDRYLVPLSQTDLLVDCLRLGCEAVSVSHCGGEGVDLADRSDYQLRVLGRDASGRETEYLADVVIDSSGVMGQPNWMGQGGGPAIGEMALRDRIEYGSPDVFGSDRNRFANRRVLLVGSKRPCESTLMALMALAVQSTGTRITWVVDGDPDHAQSASVREAVRVALEAGAVVEVLGGSWVREMVHEATSGVWRVRVAGEHDRAVEFDEIVAQVGYHPSRDFYRELRVHGDGVADCAAGPERLRRLLDGQEGGDPPATVAELVLTEPNFYVIGAKSWGRHQGFEFRHGLEQIRRLFALIGDRESLDLYAGARNLLPGTE